MCGEHHCGPQQMYNRGIKLEMSKQRRPRGHLVSSSVPRLDQRCLCPSCQEPALEDLQSFHVAFHIPQPWGHLNGPAKPPLEQPSCLPWARGFYFSLAQGCQCLPQQCCRMPGSAHSPALLGHVPSSFQSAGWLLASPWTCCITRTCQITLAWPASLVCPDSLPGAVGWALGGGLCPASCGPGRGSWHPPTEGAAGPCALWVAILLINLLQCFTVKKFVLLPS